MKKDIHPEYMDCTVTCSCGNTFKTRSTKPEIRVDICSSCHPFFTGTQKLVDSGGRVQRFTDRFGDAQETIVAKEAAKKAKRAADVEAKEAAKKAEKEAKAAAKAKRTQEFEAKKAKKSKTEDEMAETDSINETKDEVEAVNKSIEDTTKSEKE